MVIRRGGQQRIPRPQSFRPGGPPPWSELTPAQRRFTLAQIRRRLADLPPAVEKGPNVEGSQAAAVLVALYEANGEASVVLIKRPETMSSHRGEIAFPGGKFDPALDADLRDTALREAHEEVGLAPSDVEVVARLDGIGTVATRFTITPYVGFLAGPPVLTPNPSEVVRTLEVKLSELLDPESYREEHWDTNTFSFDVHFYDLEDETVWGATARILTSFFAHLVAER
ncbi:MAG TPA: CoA pyrophosphatase [Acidimicrobiia bacterium]|nr:CoA pyrophosphatase [Acidimicrobiia bacterium]